MPKEIVCFSANRICHHDDYFILIKNIYQARNEKSFNSKVKCLMSKKTIIFLDIDSLDIFFTPLIVLRSLWGGKGLGISVRTEYLLESRTIFQFVFERWKIELAQQSTRLS